MLFNPHYTVAPDHVADEVSPSASSLPPTSPSTILSTVPATASPFTSSHTVGTGIRRKDEDSLSGEDAEISPRSKVRSRFGQHHVYFGEHPKTASSSSNSLLNVHDLQYVDDEADRDEATGFRSTLGPFPFNVNRAASLSSLEHQLGEMDDRFRTRPLTSWSAHRSLLDSPGRRNRSLALESFATISSLRANSIDRDGRPSISLDSPPLVPVTGNSRSPSQSSLETPTDALPASHLRLDFQVPLEPIPRFALSRDGDSVDEGRPGDNSRGESSSKPSESTLDFWEITIPKRSFETSLRDGSGTSACRRTTGSTVRLDEPVLEAFSRSLHQLPHQFSSTRTPDTTASVPAALDSPSFLLPSRREFHCKSSSPVVGSTADRSLPPPHQKGLQDARFARSQADSSQSLSEYGYWLSKAHQRYSSVRKHCSPSTPIWSEAMRASLRFVESCLSADEALVSLRELQHEADLVIAALEKGEGHDPQRALPLLIMRGSIVQAIAECNVRRNKIFERVEGALSSEQDNPSHAIEDSNRMWENVVLAFSDILRNAGDYAVPTPSHQDDFLLEAATAYLSHAESLFLHYVVTSDSSILLLHHASAENALDQASALLLNVRRQGRADALQISAALLDVRMQRLTFMGQYQLLNALARISRIPDQNGLSSLLTSWMLAAEREENCLREFSASARAVIKEELARIYQDIGDAFITQATWLLRDQPVTASQLQPPTTGTPSQYLQVSPARRSIGKYRWDLQSISTPHTSLTRGCPANGAFLFGDSKSLADDPSHHITNPVGSTDAAGICTSDLRRDARQKSWAPEGDLIRATIARRASCVPASSLSDSLDLRRTSRSFGLADQVDVSTTENFQARIFSALSAAARYYRLVLDNSTGTSGQSRSLRIELLFELALTRLAIVNNISGLPHEVFLTSAEQSVEQAMVESELLESSPQSAIPPRNILSRQRDLQAQAAVMARMVASRFSPSLQASASPIEAAAAAALKDVDLVQFSSKIEMKWGILLPSRLQELD